MPDVPAPERPLSALPSTRARVLAFTAILVAGACGGLIGWSVTTLQCTAGCSTAGALGGMVGALFAAAGVAVVAVLALRAMGEWKRLKDEDLQEAQPPSTSRRNPSA